MRTTTEDGFNITWAGWASKGELVYFISDGEYVKIGKTTGWANNRLSALQTANARELTLLAVAFFRDGMCATQLEGWLQGQLKTYHVRGEWFELEAMQALMRWLDRTARNIAEGVWRIEDQWKYHGDPHIMVSTKLAQYEEDRKSRWKSYIEKENELIRTTDRYIKMQEKWIEELQTQIAIAKSKERARA